MASVFHRSATLPAVRVGTFVLLAAAIAAHLGWTFEFLLPTGVSPLHTPVGELSASGQSYRTVFRVANLIAGTLFVLAAPPLFRLAPVHWQGRLTVAAVFFAGLWLLAQGAFTLDCAASAGAPCAEPTFGHVVHRVTAVLLNLTYLLGAVSLVLWWQGAWRVIAAVGLAFETLAWGTSLVLRALGPAHYAGLAQRLELLVVTTLIATGAIYLLTAGRYYAGQRS